MRFLRQSTAITFRIGPFVDSTDGFTAETALALTQADYRLSKAGGAFAQKADATAGAHDSNGWYTCILNTTDTATLGSLDISVQEAGALPVWESCCVLAANIYDSLIGGGDVLQVDVSQFGNAAGIFAAGRPEVNTTHAAGTAWNSAAITAGTIATGAIGQAELAADALTAIANATWVAGTRTLTANTNLSIPTAADTRTAMGLASANLDTQLAGISAFVDTEITDILNAVNALPDANTNADALLNRNDGIYDSYTPADALRVVMAATAGPSTGHGTATVNYKDPSNTWNVITATVSGGNRSSVTLDPTA